MRSTPLDKIPGIVDRVMRRVGTSVHYVHVTASGTDALEAEGAFPRIHGGMIEGTVVQVGSVVVLLAAERMPGITPDTRGRIRVGGVSHQVVKVDPIYAGDKVAAWIIQGDG